MVWSSLETPSPGGRPLADRYVVGQPIGQGRSTVHEGQDRRLQRRVAIKEVRLAEGQEDADRVRRRALREAQAAARLNNPHVVTVYDVVEEDGSIWLVMELVESPSLAQLVADEGPLDHARAARIGLGVVSALQTAHAVGVVHRDVKPANVLVVDDDRAKLADFGVATIRDESRVTAVGSIIGSPAYMAPEQAMSAEVGPPADLWALGATLYFAVEGRAPFTGDSALATATAVVTGDPRPQQNRGPLTNLIGRLLGKDPGRRPTADHVRAALGAAAPRRTSGNRTYTVKTARLTGLDQDLTELRPGAAPGGATRPRSANAAPEAPPDPRVRPATPPRPPDADRPTRPPFPPPRQPPTPEEPPSAPAAPSTTPGSTSTPAAPTSAPPSPTPEPAEPTSAPPDSPSDAADTPFDAADTPSATPDATSDPADATSSATELTSATPGSASDAADATSGATDATSATPGSASDPAKATPDPADTTSEPAETTSATPDSLSGPAQTTSATPDRTLEPAESTSATPGSASDSAKATPDAADAASEPAESTSVALDSTSEPAEGTSGVAEAMSASVGVGQAEAEATEPARVSVPATEATSTLDVRAPGRRGEPAQGATSAEAGPRWWVLAVVVAVTLAVVGAGGWALVSEGDEPSAATGRSPQERAGEDTATTTPSDGAEQGQATSTPEAPPSTEATTTTDPSTTTTAAAEPGSGVPSEWVTYQNPAAGYTISHPPGWRVEPSSGTIVDIRDPQTGSYLRIDWTATPRDDPVADWRQQAARFASSHQGYQEIQIAPYTYRDYNAAMWEFRYQEGGAQLHTANLGFVTGGRGYALLFQTPENLWSQSQNTYTAFQTSFRPAS